MRALSLKEGRHGGGVWGSLTARRRRCHLERLAVAPVERELERRLPAVALGRRRREAQRELVAHARGRLDELGYTHVRLHNANCFSLEPSESMRFERIYVGAGASQRSAAVFSFSFANHLIDGRGHSSLAMGPASLS